MTVQTTNAATDFQTGLILVCSLNAAKMADGVEQKTKFQDNVGSSWLQSVHMCFNVAFGEPQIIIYEMSQDPLSTYRSVGMWSSYFLEDEGKIYHCLSTHSSSI